MLRWRLLLGAVFIAVLVALVILDSRAASPGIWLFPLAIVVGLAGAQEMIGMLAGAGYVPLAEIVYGGTLLVIGCNAIPLFVREVPEERPLERLAWPLLAITATVLGAFLGEMRRYRQPGGVIASAGLTMLCVAYVGLLLSFAIQLRVLGGPALGLVGLVAMIAVVKLADIGAYTVGRLFGRHKMSPVLSPGKTIEGAVGAVVFGCVGAWLVFTLLPERLGCTLPDHPLGWLWFGGTVSIAGILGDLAESLIKRDLGRKDSSAWLPGFGGVLDLLDSILFAAPVAYLAWLVMVT